MEAIDGGHGFVNQKCAGLQFVFPLSNRILLPEHGIMNFNEVSFEVVRM